VDDMVREGSRAKPRSAVLSTTTRILTASFPHSIYTKPNTQDPRHSPLALLAHEVEDDELHNRHRQSQTFDHKLANRRQSNGGRSNRRRWRFVATPTTPVIPDLVSEQSERRASRILRVQLGVE
ncbi:hypothetical protein, partial [Aminobacter carboxidus]